MRDCLIDLDERTWLSIAAAAEAGDSEAQFLLGYRLYDTRLECDGCEEWLRAAAAQDHPEAIYHLAQTTFSPQLMTVTCPETEEGRRLLTKAAELGSVNAQLDLAVCFIWGDPPFEKSLTEARFWYLQAAMQGHQEAQLAVGSMFVQGDGGPTNYQEGLALLELAAKGPDPYETESAARLLASYYSGAKGVPPNASKAREWKKRVEEMAETETQ